MAFQEYIVIVPDKNELFPLIGENTYFYFLLSKKNLYMVMKKKCKIEKTRSGNAYYKISESEEDIFLKKPALIPLVCGNKDILEIDFNKIGLLHSTIKKD